MHALIFVFTTTFVTTSAANSEASSSELVLTCYVDLDSGAVTSVTQASDIAAKALKKGDAQVAWKFYLDADNDGYTSHNAAYRYLCLPVERYTQLVTSQLADCDDSDVTVNPSVEEVAGNGKNDDCDSSTPDASAKTYKIGDTGPGGGIVFYLTPDGSSGFEAATHDQGSAQWCGLNSITGSYNTSLGSGASNLANILNGKRPGYCSTPGNAAEVASLFMAPDWFLPSKMELHWLWLNIGPGCDVPESGADTNCMNVGEFIDGFYWSSSETIEQHAWVQNFGTGKVHEEDKSITHLVRAVREF